MRLVFLDEAGISNPEHEPYMIIAAVIVDADKKLIAVQSILTSWCCGTFRRSTNMALRFTLRRSSMAVGSV